MYPQGGGPRQPDLDFEQIIGRIKDALGPIGRRLGGGGVGLVIVLITSLFVIIWLATGVYTISPGEEAALRLFGNARETPESATGLHWWWPKWVGQRDVVLTTETRSMELGFRSAENVTDAAVPVEALMISGDLNIVDVRMVVQYNIKNLNQYLFRVDDPGELVRGVEPGKPDGRTLKDASEAALRLVVGQRSIDDVLTGKREEVQTETKQRLQLIMDSYGTGIDILNIQLQDVKAPEEVRPAFDDVLQARQERDTKINQARAFENDIIPRAQGDSERIKREAEAFAQARVARAEGEAGRFVAVLEQYAVSDASKEVTRQRLYLEAMEEILPRINKIIVSPDADSVLILGGQEGLTPIPVGPSP